MKKKRPSFHYSASHVLGLPRQTSTSFRSGTDLSLGDAIDGGFMEFALSLLDPESLKALSKDQIAKLFKYSIELRDFNSRSLIVTCLYSGLSLSSRLKVEHPLLEAILLKREEYAIKLVESGSDFDISLNMNSTLLILSIKSELKRLSRVLLKRMDGRNEFYSINSTDYAGDTALLAAIVEDVELVPSLLEKGADINHFNKYGMHALDLAMTFGQYGIALLLIEIGIEELVSYPHWYVDELLFYAVSSGNQNVALRLIEAGAVSFATDNEGRTVLEIAKLKGMDKVVEILQ